MLKPPDERVAGGLTSDDGPADALAGRLVVVMGLGRFGGGAGVTRYLAGLGARVHLTDAAPAESLAAGLAAVRDLVDAGVVTLTLGRHDEGDLDGASVLVVNPAVPTPWRHPFIAAAERRGVRLETEIGLAVDELGARGALVVGVTGTVGKSTTSAMIHHGLGAAGVRSHLGGNIGGSLLNGMGGIGRGDVVVLELSSAMLHWLHATRPGFAPRVGVLTAFEPNHLDWHGTAEHYRGSKRHLFNAQRSGDAAVFARDLEAARAGDGPAWPTNEGVRRVSAGPLEGVALAVPGAHNRANAGIAAAAVVEVSRLLGTEMAKAEAGRLLAGFAGLPHRLEFVGSPGGVLCFNDSKSTTPGSAAIAVAAVRERAGVVHLVAGGADKGVDLSGVATLGAREVYTIGTTGPAIAEACRCAGTVVHECGTLEAAVRAAAGRARAGEALLLSPACASWDHFENYEARGAAFARLVGEFLGGKGEGDGTG